VEPSPPARPISPDELLDILRTVARWDADAWSRHRDRYLTAYGSLGFLPPEAQQAIVLQATIGEADGLAFGLSTAHAHRVLSRAEFPKHAEAVAALLGKRVLQCRGVFVGGSDVLRRSIDDVAGYFEEAARVFPIGPLAPRMGLRDLPEGAPRLSGLYAFLDRFEPPLPDLDDWRRLRSLHLTRVILGVESGALAVRAFYGKRWEAESLKAIVSDLKTAGLKLSVVTLVGAGGRESAEAHESETAELLNSLALGPGDLVYLVDALEVGGEPLRDRTCARGTNPLTGRDWADQQARLLAALKPIRTVRGAKVVPYSLEKQWA
jgi:hypothetical protein